jgi:hypothetical protein
VLLPKELGAASPNLGARLGGSCAGASIRQLTNQRLVNQGRLEGQPKNGLIQLYLVDYLSFSIANRYLHRLFSTFPGTCRQSLGLGFLDGD